MTYLLSTFDFSTIGFMTIFDFIIVIYGAYSVYAARQMIKTNEPPQWLIAKDDIGRVQKPAQFCSEMYPKTMLFGIICMAYGIYGLIEWYYIQRDFWEAFGVTIFVLALIWFIITLQNTKRRYIQK
ncbi:MAG: hypothetical protein LIO56_06920 [Lachnospiraceae bacterium]|nr:hypothetical protein [Lachnospiraceae bacterium]